MKLDIRECKECKRKTLQAKTQISNGYDLEGTVFRKVWFCSHCGTYWAEVTEARDERVLPQ